MTDSAAEIARIDTRGLYCPVPILRTRDRLRRLAAGAVLEVLSDDPGILEDMPAFCRSHGHDYLGHVEAPGRAWRVTLKKVSGARR
jgi:tRNA 2-thiouridine synthesizing protein A